MRYRSITPENDSSEILRLWRPAGRSTRANGSIAQRLSIHPEGGQCSHVTDQWEFIQRKPEAKFLMKVFGYMCLVPRHQSLRDKLCKDPNRRSAPELVRSLDRVEEIRRRGSTCPPGSPACACAPRHAGASRGGRPWRESGSHIGKRISPAKTHTGGSWCEGRAQDEALTRSPGGSTAVWMEPRRAWTARPAGVLALPLIREM